MIQEAQQYPKYYRVTRVLRLGHLAASHPKMKASWRDLGPRKGVQFSRNWNYDGHRPLSIKLLEACRTDLAGGWRARHPGKCSICDTESGERREGRERDRLEGKSDGLIRQSPAVSLVLVLALISA